MKTKEGRSKETENCLASMNISRKIVYYTEGKITPETPG